MDAAEVALVRKTMESALESAVGGDIAAVLDGLGWAELRAADPAVAVGELFEAQGRLGAVTNALDIVVASALCAPLPPGTAVVHPGLVAWDRPPGQVEFEGLVLAGTERAIRLLVPVAGQEGTLEAVALDAGGADIRPVAGLDPALGLVAVGGRAAGLAEPVPFPGWEPVAAAARRALAHELCGLGQAMLDDAVTHVTQRHQFGRPIAAFQTVRHRLTEVFVALASARAALDASWESGDPLLGDAAKALAGRAALLAARHCLQVSGAIGFTEEYGLAARIRRAMMLDALYGSADQLRSRIGAGLVARQAVPRLHPLAGGAA